MPSPLPRRRRAVAPVVALLSIVLVASGACDRAGVSPVPGASQSGVPSASSVAPVPPSASATPCASPPVAAGMSWWNERVFYEVFVRSFADSDGDGIGDLRGLIGRLDYLNDGDPATTDDLGVTGLWLMPVAESPSYHGYDVVDYRAIERDYGTADDFRDLVAAAHERGIAVIVDLVMNHTSREHPWFVESQGAGSEREDWYLWETDRPRVGKPGGGLVWHELGERYYYGYFWEGMPDLNLANEAVTAELDAIARYWLDDLGVDGFRLDAIKHFFEDGRELEDVPESKAWLAAFHDRVEAIAPDTLLVGESYDVTSQSAAYVPDAVDITFEFGLAGSLLLGVDNANAGPIRSALQETLAAYPPGQFGTFLTNHDQARVTSRLGDPREARVAASVYLTLPGVPFIYYGEEIGMQGGKPDERIRTPMAWDATTPGAGFTDGEPWQPLADGLAEANVAGQTADEASLLAHYRSLVRLRAAQPALRTGDAIALETTEQGVWAVVRRTADEIVVVLVNLDDEPAAAAAVDLTTALPCGTAITGAEVLLGDAVVAPPTGDAASWVPVETLDAYETVVLRLTP